MKSKHTYPWASASFATMLLLLASPLPGGAADPAGGGGAPGGVPPDDPNQFCAAQCDAAFQKALQACTQPDGQLDPECVAAVKTQFDFDQCVAGCNVGNGGPDPVVAACQSACYDAYASGLQTCIDASGNLDAECVAARDIEFVECFTHCGDVPWLPDLAACAQGCTQAFRDGLETCRADGAIDFVCFKEKRGAYNDCLGACGLSLLPPEDICASNCESAFQSALAKCGAVPEPNGVAAGGDEECITEAKMALEACLSGCGIVIPDQILCAESCDGALKLRLAGCQGDADCEKFALADYSKCLEGCGIVVPPIPEPDPCVGPCDAHYKEALETCFKQDTGEVDGECLRQADESYLACLSACGINLPPPPPDPNPGCTTVCKLSYEQALQKCYLVKADGNVEVDGECAAAADAALLQCLASCGVEPAPAPGDPGLPPGKCEQECGGEILAALFDCAAANGGVVDPNCLLEKGNAFNECLARCKEQADQRALGAQARSGDRLFLRGDSDRSGALEITDAIYVLSFLFLGGGAPSCFDAADANDDGTVNISDASTILGSLFLGTGSLPEPSKEAGPDPTPDALDCSGS